MISLGLGRGNNLPVTFFVAVSEALPANFAERGFVTLYEDALLASLHLPLHPLARDFMIFLVIAPASLPLLDGGS